MKDLSLELSKCNTPAEFVNFAQRRGAQIRCKNHYFIKHPNGERTVISCTPKPKIPLHKTMKEFKTIYLNENK